METTEHTENTEGGGPEKMISGVLYRGESHEVLGACFNVYRDKGCGFVEPVYHDCLAIEFDYRRIPFQSKPSLVLSYRGKLLPHTYEPDFICHGKIIVEVKAVAFLLDEHRAQLLNYLKATGLRLGYLVNFGHYPKLEYERFVL
ncbi:MAG: GxxExxY protein [bacterium]